MSKLEMLDELAQKLSHILPDSIATMRADLAKNFKDILQASFAKMNLVSREEFDKQSAILQKAREKLDQLEKQLHTMHHHQDKHKS